MICPAVVVARQRKHRLMIELEFVIVIVFHDDEAELRGERPQPQPCAWAQHDGRGELMAGRQIDGAHARAAADGFEMVEVDSLGAELGRLHLSASEGEGLHRRRIGQFLEDHRIVLGDDAVGDDIECHLAAARDADVFRHRVEAARHVEHFRDRLAQSLGAARIAVAEEPLARGGACGARIGLRDHRRRDEPLVGHAVVEAGLAFAWPEQRRLDGAPARLGNGLRRFRLGFLGRAVADVARDECAAALVGRHPALRGEFVIGLHDGLAIDFEILGEIAGAGQAVAGGEPAALDIFDDRLRDADAETAAPLGTDDEVRIPWTQHTGP